MMDWRWLIYEALCFLAIQAGIYWGIFKPQMRKLQKAREESDELWKAAIDEIQKQVYGGEQ